MKFLIHKVHDLDLDRKKPLARVTPYLFKYWWHSEALHVLALILSAVDFTVNLLSDTVIFYIVYIRFIAIQP